MKKVAIFLASVIAALSFVSLPVAAADDACSVVDRSDPNYELYCPSVSKTNSTAQSEIKHILDTVYLYVGIIAVIVMVIGGVFYIISNGDPGKAARAKMTIICAAIGLAVAVLAFAITSFVFNAAGGNI